MPQLRFSSLVLAVLLLAACGRGDVKGLGSDGSTTSPGVDVGFGDGTVPDFGPGPRDAAPGDGPRPSDGGFGECLTPLDCFRANGPTSCTPGRWQCVNDACVEECDPQVACTGDCDCVLQEGVTCNRAGFCEATGQNNQCCFPTCEPGERCELPGGQSDICPEEPPVCVNDCDCPDALACLGGGCRVANRNNQCCSSPLCPPGQTCELPGGGFGMCPPPPGCMNDCDCPFELICGANGRCRPSSSQRNACCLNPFCPPGNTCVTPIGGSDICPSAPDAGVPDVGPGPDGGSPDSGVPMSTIGDACFPGTCSSSEFCIEEQQGFPGGYCTAPCMGAGGGACPSGSSCQDFGPGNEFCLDNCQSQVDCRMGYDCIALSPNRPSVCWPGSPSSTNPNGNAVGGTCQQANDCVTGLQCFDESSGGWPGGYCTIFYCDPMTNPCPGASLCFSFPGAFSLCLEPCPSGGTQSTCRPGYYCLGPTGQPGACISN